MSSSPFNEVSVQINPNSPVAALGEASEISSCATTSIEHGRGGLKKRLEGCEGTGDRRRAEGGKSIRVVGISGDAVGDDIGGDLGLNPTWVHSSEI